jgi:hypothetical protein
VLDVDRVVPARDRESAARANLARLERSIGRWRASGRIEVPERMLDALRTARPRANHDRAMTEPNEARSGPLGQVPLRRVCIVMMSAVGDAGARAAGDHRDQAARPAHAHHVGAATRPRHARARPP